MTAVRVAVRSRNDNSRKQPQRTPCPNSGLRFSRHVTSVASSDWPSVVTTSNIPHSQSAWSSPSWSADGQPTTQKIPNISWKPVVHYRAHKTQFMYPLLRQINSISFRPILISTYRLRQGLSNVRFLSVLPIKFSRHVSTHWRVQHITTYATVLELITFIFHEEVSCYTPHHVFFYPSLPPEEK
jgi:hypothetical protein